MYSPPYVSAHTQMMYLQNCMSAWVCCILRPSNSAKRWAPQVSLKFFYCALVCCCADPGYSACWMKRPRLHSDDPGMADSGSSLKMKKRKPGGWGGHLCLGGGPLRQRSPAVVVERCDICDVDHCGDRAERYGVCDESVDRKDGIRIQKHEQRRIVHLAERRQRH